MSQHQAVRSSLEISKSIAYYLEMSEPQSYPPMELAHTVRRINDILQGRTDATVPQLLSELQEKGSTSYAGEIARIAEEIDAFFTQKALLSEPYDKSSSKQYQYQYTDGLGDRPLKIIDQRLFDDAAKAGFPPGFFRESFFKNVTIHCLPDHADLNFSRFSDCRFAVCRIHHASFDGTSIYDCEFHSTDMHNTTFFNSTLAYTHFYDNTIKQVSFQKAYLKVCNTRDCTMEGVNFLGATLDGCNYERVSASEIKNLDSALITMGGATREECNRNKVLIYQALQEPKDILPMRRPKPKPKHPHKHEQKSR